MIKKLLMIVLVMISLNGFGQQLQQRWSSITDPAIGKIELTDVSGTYLDPAHLTLGQLVRLTIPVSNRGQKALPAGSCKLKIGLGTKLELDHSFSLSSARLGEYFAWTVSESGGQWEINGDLVADLPANFQSVTVFFRVGGIREGNSTITANFLVSNHHTENTLSDFDPNNNTSYLAYNLKKPSRVTFTDLYVNKTGCTINVSFATDNVVSVTKYEVETSKDMVNYVKVGEATARNMMFYNNFSLNNDIKAPTIYVRIKVLKADGSYQYSDVKSVGGSCEQPWTLNLYPNPVSEVRVVTITATEGVFNGKYKVSVTDASGKQAQVREVTLNYVTNFRYDLGVLGSGQYMLQIVNTDGSQSAVLKFEKL